MPLFMLKEEVFDCMNTGQKAIELRRDKAKAGEQVVFQCGQNSLRRMIISKEDV